MKYYQQAQFLWVEGRLSNMERLCLASFVNHGWEVSLYHYGPVTGVPAGVTLKDGRDILPADRVIKAPGVGGPSYAYFSDLFRYYLIYQRGGWWFDTDFVAIRPPKPVQELKFASTWENEWGECANGCATFAEPGNQWIGWLQAAAEQKIAAQQTEFGAIGPFLVQHLVKEHNLRPFVSRWYEFCPVPWRMMNRVVYQGHANYLKDRVRMLKHLVLEIRNPQFKAGYLRRETQALHLHNEIWKASGLAKDGHYHPWCLYERLKARHGIGNVL